ncbi:hypothetical protein GYH30_018685 [Glycine max]|nr:hypothetical protein GYH30_018685 [Glycine max]
MNFLHKLKAEVSCEGRVILVLPRPIMSMTPVARPWSKKFEARENKKHENGGVLFRVEAIGGLEGDDVLLELVAGGGDGVVRRDAARVVVVTEFWGGEVVSVTVESGEGGIGRAAPCGPISEGDIVVAIIDPQELATDVKY